MVMVWWAVAFGQELPAGALLRVSDATPVAATSLVVSIDGSRVLVFGPDRAVLVGSAGEPLAEVQRDGITGGDVAANGRFVLVHDGGVTLHGDAGREQLRLATFGRVADLALSPDGRHLAVASTLALTVNDAVDGRTLWTSDGAATRVAWDPKGGLWADRDGVVTSFNPANGRPTGAGPMPERPGFLARGCVRGATADLCPVGGDAVGLARDDRLWLLEGGTLQRWTLLSGSQVRPWGSDGGAAIVGLAWMGSADLLVARLDGHLERRGPDGAVVADVTIPDCNACTPPAFGADPDGGFWVLGPTGAWMAWNAAGAPAMSKPKSSGAISARRLPDGRWVSLGSDGRARVGAAPGKGAATKPVPGARGVDAAGDTIAVWSDAGLWTYDPKGRSRAVPALGAGRKPVSVELSDDGTRVAVLDDGGALHVYDTADGRSMFRNSAGIAGSALGWSPSGDTLYAGGAPLRMFGSFDGVESGRLVLSPTGPIELVAVAGDGSLAVTHTGPDAQVLRHVTGLSGASGAVEPSPASDTPSNAP